MINARTNYGQKGLHGLYWGIHRFVDSNWCIKMKNMGGSVERLPDQDLSRVKSTDSLVIMGNIWVHKDEKECVLFRHPDIVNKTGADWWYWDNPQLPHLLYRGDWNPMGHKNWMRLIQNNTATPPTTAFENSDGRINRQLNKITHGKHTTWESIVGPRRPVEARSKVALLCPSGAGIFPNYYNINKTDWIREKTLQLQKQGWEVILRDKPSRGQREIDNGKLYEQLTMQNIGITVSIHSVGPVESLLAGVPAIVEGRHAGGPGTTPWQDFIQTGAINTPHQSDVDAWVETILNHTYHKTEAYTGEWHNGK